MNNTVYPIKVCQSFFKNYCYLVIHVETRDAILIDPAWEIDKIEEALNINKAKLTAILLTHYHIDHTNLAEPLALKYKIPVFMSKIESEFYDFSCYNLILIQKFEPIILNHFKIAPILTPGHTKGGTCYWIDNNLFTGDTLFIEGCGICTGKGADPNVMFDSLSHLKAIIPHETKIYPGHSFGQEPGTSFNYVLQNNIYLNFTELEKFVAFRMRKNQKDLLSFK